MASGSNYLTTYYAKRIIGDTAAATASNALLQTGTNITTDTWIISRTNRSTNYGIKYSYDYDATRGTPLGDADKIEFYGGYAPNNTDTPTAWIQLDAGDLYILGNAGFGAAPDNTHQLYVNGTTKLLGHVGIGTDADTSVNNPYQLYTQGRIRFNIGTIINNTVSDDSTSDKWFIIGQNGYQYLSFGANGIQAYDNSDNPSTLYLNNNGGQILIGTDPNGSSNVDGNTYITGKVGIGYDPDTSQNTYQLYVNGTGYYTGNVKIEKSVPQLIVKNTNTSQYSILQLNTAASDSAGTIFINDSNRTTDGGANNMTIRNNIGNLRLDNTVTITGTTYFANGTTYYMNDTGDLKVRTLGVAQTGGTEGLGISLYNGPTTGGAPTYGLMFAKTATFGTHSPNLTGPWATYFTMSNNTDRGWIFRCGTTNVASISGAGYITGVRVYNAVWNDYAEYRECDLLPPGCCVQENDNGKLTIADQRLIAGASIISDTYGTIMGETEQSQTPIAVSGRVLAYTYLPREMYHAGQVVCSAPGGTIDIMTREEIIEYPDAIIGVVSEIPNYETWGTGNVEVNGRIWIKVK